MLRISGGDIRLAVTQSLLLGFMSACASWGATTLRDRDRPPNHPQPCADLGPRGMTLSIGPPSTQQPCQNIQLGEMAFIIGGLTTPGC